MPRLLFIQLRYMGVSVVKAADAVGYPVRQDTTGRSAGTPKDLTGVFRDIQEDIPQSSPTSRKRNCLRSFGRKTTGVIGGVNLCTLGGLKVYTCEPSRTYLRVVAMFTVEEFFVIRDLHHQGLKISQISRKTGYHRNMVRKYLAAQTVPILAPRRTRPSKLDPFKEYIHQRISEHPLSAARICREIQEMRFDGKCTVVKDYIHTIRPQKTVQAVLWYETKPGVQA